MICVSRVSEPLDGLRLPSLAVWPSPKPTATDGTPIARISDAATAYLPGEERNFKGASRVVGLSWTCDTLDPVPVAVMDRKGQDCNAACARRLSARPAAW